MSLMSRSSGIKNVFRVLRRTHVYGTEVVINDKHTHGILVEPAERRHPMYIPLGGYLKLYRVPKTFHLYSAFSLQTSPLGIG